MAVPIATCGVVTFRRTLKLLSFFCSPVHAFAGGCASVAAATRSVCVAGGRCGPVYAAPVPACTDRLEACEEGTAVQGIGREGGFESDTSKDMQIEEGHHIGQRIAGSGAHVADAHAGERCGKRLRSSAP